MDLIIARNEAVLCRLKQSKLVLDRIVDEGSITEFLANLALIERSENLNEMVRFLYLKNPMEFIAYSTRILAESLILLTDGFLIAKVLDVDQLVVITYNPLKNTWAVEKQTKQIVSPSLKQMQQRTNVRSYVGAVETKTSIAANDPNNVVPLSQLNNKFNNKFNNTGPRNDSAHGKYTPPRNQNDQHTPYQPRTDSRTNSYFNNSDSKRDDTTWGNRSNNLRYDNRSDNRSDNRNNNQRPDSKPWSNRGGNAPRVERGGRSPVRNVAKPAKLALHDGKIPTMTQKQCNDMIREVKKVAAITTPKDVPKDIIESSVRIIQPPRNVVKEFIHSDKSWAEMSDD